MFPGQFVLDNPVAPAPAPPESSTSMSNGNGEQRQVDVLAQALESLGGDEEEPAVDMVTATLDSLRERLMGLSDNWEDDL